MRIYTLEYQWVATHEKATQPGERKTHPDHLPPEKLPGLTCTRERCLDAARQVGPATLQLVQQLLDDPGVDRLRTAGRVVSLGERYGSVRLESACGRALWYGDYRTVKRILEHGLDETSIPSFVEVPVVSTFARDAEELVGHLFDGEALSWN